MLQWLLKRLGVRAHERRLVVRLTILHFALIASYTLARAARDAVFLDVMTAKKLPYLYVAVAAWTALVSTLFGRFSMQQTLQRSLSQLLVVCGAVLGAFALLLLHFPGPIAVVSFYLWTGAYGLILVSLFWVLVNEATDPREARRLLGIIGASGILGGMVAGGLATVLGGAIGPESTLWVAGAMLAAIAPLASNIIDPGSSRAIRLESRDAPPPGWERDRYVVLLSVLFLAGGITASLLDYQFKMVVERVSGGDRMELTRLLGSYYAILNALALLLQVFASGWLLRRLGAPNVASLLPAGVTAGVVLMLVQPATALFAAASRMYEAGLRISIAKTAWEFFYFPLQPGLRRRVRTWIDAVVDRSSEAVGGLLILLLEAFGLAGGRALGVATLVVSSVWLAATLRMRRAYVDQLTTSLRTLVVDDSGTAQAPEAQLIEGAHALLDSPYEKRVLYGFELLERLDPEGLDIELGKLQDHPSAVVRARALARLADPARPVASPLLSALAHDDSVEVRTQGFRLFAARFADAEAQMRKLLESEDEAARAAALAYLVAKPTAADAALEARIDEVLRSGSAAERRAVAVGLGRGTRGVARTRERLAALLRDPDPEVRREALAACAAAGERELVPVMLPLLATSPTRDAARVALASFGNRIVGTLGDAFADMTLPTTIRRQLPAVLADIGSQEAANELLRVPVDADPLLRLRALKAQNRIRNRSPHVVFPRPAVRAALEREVEAFLRLHVHLDVWEAEEPTRARNLLYGSLVERRDATFDRIFRRLGLLYPAHEMFLGYRALSGAVRRTRAQALEYLDAVLLPEDRRLLVPTMEDPARRAVLAEALYRIPRYTRDTSLAELLRSSDPWLQACALYVIGATRLSHLRDAVRSALGAEAAIVREMATWSLNQLEAAT